MVALKDYSPQSIVSPASVVQALTSPWDFNAVQKQISDWNTLYNNKAITEQNQLKADEERQRQEAEKSVEEEIKRRIEEQGMTPNQISMSDVYKSVGDLENYMKQSELDAKNQKLATQQELDTKLKLEKIGKTNPALAEDMATKLGLQGYHAPKQKTGGEGGGKPKAVSPEYWYNTETKEKIPVDKNDPLETKKAYDRGFVPLDKVEKAGFDTSSPPSPVSNEPGVSWSDRIAAITKPLFQTLSPNQKPTLVRRQVR